jgi:hypothetical protein
MTPCTSANKIPLGTRPLRANQIVAASKTVSDTSIDAKLASLEAKLNQQTKLISVLIEEYKKIGRGRAEMKKQIEVGYF